ncbi:MAG: M28 family peptidase [Nitrospinaceae bacterium]
MKKASLIVLLMGMAWVSGRSYLEANDAGKLRPYRQIAWNHLKTLTGYGPRFPGSPGYFQTVERIKQVGREYADEMDVQKFSLPRAKHGPLTMSNIRLKFRGTRSEEPILIGAHYDTRPFADEEPDPALRSQPILGANDGGSGTAVLLALAQYFHRHRQERPIHLVFFDGEDYGRKGSGENLLGSSHYALSLKKGDTENWPFLVLIIDMVADRNLEIYKETISMKSAPWLLDLLLKVAREKGFPQFRMKSKYTLYDDHYPFAQRGIPSAVLIDFDYPYWHKLTDTLDKCSPESLFAVFSVVVETLGKI